MRVLELGKFYPPARGGMETALEQVCRALRRRRHRVLALVSAAGPRPALERRDGVVVQRLAHWRTVRSVPLNPALPAALWRARRRFRPDLVHLHLPHPAMAAAWRLLGDDSVPLVVSFHSDIVRQRRLLRFYEPLRQSLLSRADAIVVSSEALREESPALRRHRDRCRVIPLGVDLDRLARVPAREVGRVHHHVGERFLLFVGRLVYYKGLEVLLEALQGDPRPLVVVGDGPLRRRWEEEAVERGLGGWVHFLGDVEADEVRALYHACTALVLPSRAPSEAFGLVQLEAMACARPVVAARASGGVASVTRDGETGLLVPPGDPAALRQALDRIWNEEGLARRLGRAGRDRVRAFFDESRTTARLVDLLEEVGGS